MSEGKERQGNRKGGGSAKSICDHPEDGKAVTLRSGRLGPYVQHGQIRATLPRDMEPDTVTLDAAVALIAAKAAKGGAPAKGKKPAKEAPAPKAKKSTAAKGVKSPAAKAGPAAKAKSPAKPKARVPRKAAAE